jgi:protein-S-isoprenylcysteine O-methyltransferase Ste14
VAHHHAVQGDVGPGLGLNGLPMLSSEVVSLVVGLTWALVGIFWAVNLWWERTDVTDARRRELDAQGADVVSRGIRAWRVSAVTVCAVIPALFAIDGLVRDLGILYAPGLSFLAGPDLALQIAGIAMSVAGLAILIGVGWKLAVHVYRRALSERELMTTGVHRYVRHPFYLGFFLLPIGLFLVTLNYLSLLVLAAYTMLWQPRPVTWWMKEEDEDLRRRFGAEADAYIARTGRIFPRLRRS